MGKDPVGPSITTIRHGVCSRYSGDRDSGGGSESHDNASKPIVW